jgi:hypothetical protein
MEKDKIKDAILKTAGYPQSGVIAEMADAMAEAIANLGKPMETKKFEPVQETRITEIKETR